MGKIVVIENITLDGVMQAPGRAGEDERRSFSHGGWAQPFQDDVLGEKMSEGMKDGGPLLFGRRTYADFYGFWPAQQDNPITDVLNAAQKYVVSTTLREPLPWQHSTLIDGDVVAAVTELKRRSDKNIGVLGSGELVRSMLAHELIDEFVLVIHPLVLGTGRRLFGEGNPPTGLTLIDTVTTTTGAIIATYRR